MHEIMNSNITKKSNFQNTKRIPKNLKIWKDLYLSQASLRGWGRPCCWPTPWTLANSPAHLQSGTNLTVFNLPLQVFKIENQNNPASPLPACNPPGHSAEIFSATGCFQHHPEPGATESVKIKYLWNDLFSRPVFSALFPIGGSLESLSS